MSEKYIEGAKDRANKADRKRFYSTQFQDQYDQGWESMQAILGPIEDAIICHTIKYKIEAEKFVRDLEDSFRDRGTDGSGVDSPQPAFPVA